MSHVFSVTVEHIVKVKEVEKQGNYVDQSWQFKNLEKTRKFC